MSEILEIESTEKTNLPVVKTEKEKKKRRKTEKPNDDVYKEFPDLATLMNVSVEQLKDEFFLFQIRKLMGKMAKTVVRFDISDKELLKAFSDAKALSLDEILVAPAYLPACEKQLARVGKDGFKVGVIIGFPFGEDTFRGMYSTMKECIRMGVDEATVVMPSLIINNETIKMLRKQTKKVGKAFKGRSGIALNASDLTEDKLVLAVKTVQKTKIEFITLIFNSASQQEVEAKLRAVNKVKGDKKIFVFANVSSPEGIIALFKNQVDKILTPFADDIGKDLLKRFKVKSIKLD